MKTYFSINGITASVFASIDRMAGAVEAQERLPVIRDAALVGGGEVPQQIGLARDHRRVVNTAVI